MSDNDEGFEMNKSYVNAMGDLLMQRTERVKASLANPETSIAFSQPGREVMRIVPTETGFDVKIPDGVTMTEAAKTFIETVKQMLLTRPPLKK
jgi:hypothetical protein